MHRAPSENVPVRTERWGLDVLFLALVVLAAVALVDPVGDFPLNDDWSYGLTVQRLVNEGTYHPFGWQAMSLVSHVLWGALFSSVFGFSFTVLRFATLVLSLVAVLSLYFFTKEMGGGRAAGVVAALTLAFNPVYFALSNTFMSDVSFAGFVALSMLLLFRSLKFDSDIYLLSGALVVVVAVLCRQNGLFIPIAFGIAHLVRYGVSFPRLLRAGSPGLAAAGALFLYQGWLEVMDRMPVEYGAVSRLDPGELLNPLRLVVFALAAVTYLGLFLAPVLAWTILSPAAGARPARWGRMGIALGSFMVLMVVLRPEISPLPHIGNVLVPEGIGPSSLRDTYLLELPNVDALPAVLWTAMRVIGLIGGVILCAYLLLVGRGLISSLTTRKLDDQKTGAIFCLVAAAVCIAPLPLAEALFDRYLIPIALVLIPVLISFRGMLSFSVPPALRGAAVGLMIAAFMAFSVLTTHDYLAWNRARWSAVEDLIDGQGIDPSQIDGGFEVNGFYLYAEDYTPRPDGSKSWWWVADDLYMLSFGSVPGYGVERRYEFPRWLAPGTGSVVVLKRESHP